MTQPMRPDVQRWYERRTYSGTAWRPADLVDRKGDATISVVLPAHNEAATVGGIVSSLRREFMQRMPLIDEVVVVDSRSADATCSVATAAGARVVSADALLPEHGAVPGKGEALWKSLHAVSGDIVVFLDADLDELPYQFVPGLLGPLLADASISYVKAAYDRPLLPGTGIAAGSGGRVT
ncbi:MAG: glycosyltransferase, partial [Mycobacteriales bacterium]